VNHLSTWRKRKQVSDSVSSGERRRKSLNQLGYLNWGRGISHIEVTNVEVSQTDLERPTKERDSRVDENLQHF
jgi:hypothetical protein